MSTEIEVVGGEWESSRAASRKAVRAGGAVGRNLPHSEEMEEALLSMLMLDGREVMGKCLAVRMREEWFYDTKRGRIFAVLFSLYQRDLPMEAATVAEELASRHELEQAGGYPFITQISKVAPTTAQAGYFVERVRDLAALRAIYIQCVGLTEKAFTMDTTGGEIANELELHQAWVSRTLEVLRADAMTMKQQADVSYQRTLDKIAGKPDKSRWIFTGLASFDRKFGAFDANNEDWLVVIGGPPSGAKSSWMRMVILHNLRQGKTVAVWLLETGFQLQELLACTATGIGSESLAALPSDLAVKYREALDEMHGYVGKTLFIYADGAPVETVVARLDEHARRWGEPDFVAIDHIHLLNSSQKGMKREQEMGYIAKTLARSAKRHNRTYFALAQLNRSARADGRNDRPEPHHLRDSGEIEQAARRIMLLHTPTADMRGAEQTKNQDQVMMELYQAKHNNGKTGWVEVWFRRSTTRFGEIGAADLAARKLVLPPEPSGSGASKSNFKDRP